jgi:hypothetical protein
LIAARTRVQSGHWHKVGLARHRHLRVGDCDGSLFQRLANNLLGIPGGFGQIVETQSHIGCPATGFSVGVATLSAFAPTLVFGASAAISGDIGSGLVFGYVGSAAGPRRSRTSPHHELHLSGTPTESSTGLPSARAPRVPDPQRPQPVHSLQRLGRSTSFWRLGLRWATFSGRLHTLPASAFRISTSVVGLMRNDVSCGRPRVDTGATVAADSSA